jgi:hypothetical protein
MSESILTSVKKTLGLAEDYTAFDADIVLYINGVLADLHQIGVGPTVGFQITDATETWTDFIPADPTFNNVQLLVCLRVRLLFDPPDSGYAQTAFQNQIDQLVWRIREHREELQPEVPA